MFVGKMWARVVLVVKCADCGKESTFPSKSKAEAAKHFAVQGWRLDEELGWLCRDCEASFSAEIENGW